MHNTLVLSIFSLTFLVLTILSETTGDPGSQALRTLPDDIPLLQTQQQSAQITGDVKDEKPPSKDIKDGRAKSGGKDLHTGASGKKDWNDLRNSGWGKNFWDDLFNDWSKRSQQVLQDLWSKRAWNDLKGGSWGKRDWNQFRGGWGKRNKNDQSADTYDDPENLENEEVNEEIEDDLLEHNKREWDNLRGAWGKRDWKNFRGSWGKRDPDWGSLKGLWGKRGGGIPNFNKLGKLPILWRRR